MKRVIVKEGKFLIAYVFAGGSLNEEQFLAWYDRYGFIESNDGGYPLVRPYKAKTRKVSNDI